MMRLPLSRKTSMEMSGRRSSFLFVNLNGLISFIPLEDMAEAKCLSWIISMYP